jgi:hypothetical protein
VSAFDVLAPYARPARPATPAGEACELCAAPVPARHRHLVDPERRALRCACETCARLFRAPSAGARWRTVPERILVDPGFALTATEWAALEIPVGLAFVFPSAATGRWTAFYPSPAGATESELPLERWLALAAEHPLVAAVEPDVEALLVRGERGRPGDRYECFLVPIDVAYELVGRIRRRWRGFDGGDAVRRELAAFFAELRARSRALPRAGAAGGSR